MSDRPTCLEPGCDAPATSGRNYKCDEHQKPNGSAGPQQVDLDRAISDRARESVILRSLAESVDRLEDALTEIRVVCRKGIDSGQPTAMLDALTVVLAIVGDPS